MRRKIKENIFCVAPCALLFALSFPSQAQQPTNVPRIGFLMSTSPSNISDRIEAFRQGLGELGYVEGKNIVIEWRYAEGKLERLPALAAELVRLKVDVIVSAGPALTRFAKEATSTIPIVMTFDNDPVGSGFVASLARPGGNITGYSTISPDLSGKRLELLREVVPRLSRVAFLWNPDVRGAVLDYKETEGVARSLGLQVQSVEASRAENFERAFTAITKERAQALIVPGPNPVGFTNRGQIASFTQKNRLPSIYGQSEYVDAGGLMSYGYNTADLWRRAATYVDKILKGAKAAELPVEQPTKFELTINLKTAKQIGVTIPKATLYQADRVIK